MASALPVGLGPPVPVPSRAAVGTLPALPGTTRPLSKEATRGTSG